MAMLWICLLWKVHVYNQIDGPELVVTGQKLVKASSQVTFSKNIDVIGGL